MQPDTSRKPTVEPSGFVRDEWLETLSRIKADQPRRYAKEVSAGLSVTVSKYEELKAAHERHPRGPAEGQRRERPSRTVKTNKKKPKRSGAIGAPRPPSPQGTVRQ